MIDKGRDGSAKTSDQEDQEYESGLCSMGSGFATEGWLPSQQHAVRHRAGVAVLANRSTFGGWTDCPQVAVAVFTPPRWRAASGWALRRRFSRNQDLVVPPIELVWIVWSTRPRRIVDAHAGEETDPYVPPPVLWFRAEITPTFSISLEAEYSDSAVLLANRMRGQDPFHAVVDGTNGLAVLDRPEDGFVLGHAESVRV